MQVFFCQKVAVTMLVVQALLLLALQSEGVYMAPIAGETDPMTCKDPIQCELDQILEEALLNDTENLVKIKNAFAEIPEVVKVCLPFNYTIFCEDDGCENKTTFNCSNGYSASFIWTSFDPYDLTGSLLLVMANFNWTVFGFDWGGACDLRSSNTPVLNINVSSLQLLCGVNWEKYIKRSLRSLTNKMPFNELQPTIRFHSKEREEVESIFSVSIVLLIYGVFLSVFAHAVIYSRAELYTKSEGNKKPQAYFQFWAFHIFYLSFLIYTVYENVIHNEDQGVNNVIWTMLGWGALFPMVCSWIIVICCDIETPTHCCRYCCGKYYCICHYSVLCISMSTFTLFMIFSALTIPTLVFIHYLYPARTLARLPLIVSAILYINTLLSYLIFQCERLCFLGHKFCVWCKGESDDEDDDQEVPKQIENHDGYYASETKDKKLMVIISFFVLPLFNMFTIAVLVIFLKMTNKLAILNRNTDDENFKLLLSLIPTVLLLVGFWAKSDEFCGTKKKKKENNEGDYELLHPA